MKKLGLILLAVFIFSIGSSFRPLMAQDKTKAEKEKELRIQEEIDQQKKAMVEAQKNAQEDIQKAMEESQQKMQDIRFNWESSDTNGPGFKPSRGQRGNRTYSFDINNEPFVFSLPDFNFYGHSSDNGERSSWIFSKSLKESSLSRDYVFDVEKSAKTVVMTVNGDCKAGEIRIKIVMPNGKIYSDVVIDEFGNLNWRKSFNITEEENKDKAGEWKYEIKASKATGFFKITLQTY